MHHWVVIAQANHVSHFFPICAQRNFKQIMLNNMKPIDGPLVQSDHFFMLTNQLIKFYILTL